MKKDRNLFEAHAGANQEIAKSAMELVIRKNIAKHIKLQELMTKTLLSGDNEYLVKNIEKVGAKMVKYNSIVAELCSSWNTMFGEEFDSTAAVLELCGEWYPIAANKEPVNPYKTDSTTVTVSGNNDDVENIIREALEGKLPGNVKVQLVNTKRAVDEARTLFGLDPLNYDSFDDFLSAVKSEMLTRKADGTLGEVSEELSTMVEEEET